MKTATLSKLATAYANKEGNYILSKNGTETFRGTESECYHKLQRSQSQSADWAMKYEGWKIEPVNDVVEKLISFVNQKSGLNPNDYIDRHSPDPEGMKYYKSTVREIGLDKKDFFELLALAQRRLAGTLNEKLKFNLENTGGRLVLLPNGELEYTPGQMEATEYRPAASRMLAQLIWNDYANEKQDTESEGMIDVYKTPSDMRKAISKHVSRRVMNGYFKA